MNLHAKLFCFLVVSFPPPVPASAADAWEKLMDKKSAVEEMPIVTNRAVTKAGKWQIMGPLFGMADRRDLSSHLPLSIAARRYFSESHAWEVFRIQHDFHSLSEVAQNVVNTTGYVVDAQQADWSISTGYVYSPVYGKYAFSDSKLVHFDGYLGISAGARFARSTQFTIEPFLGMQHYLTSYFSIILPELRMRLYTERRSASSEFVSEFVCQVGMSWLL